MRLKSFIITPTAAVLIASCAPVPDRPQDRSIPPNLAIDPAEAPPTKISAEAPDRPPSSSFPAFAPRLSQKTIRGIAFEGVTFDSRTHRLVVVDQAGGPGTTFVSSAALAKSKNALLAINAGFFTPEGAPLGLVISAGKNAGEWNSASSLGNGIFRESASGALSITRRSSKSSVLSSRELIQAGPLLLENSKPISGLDNGKSALRSIILTDGKSRWWIGKTSSCSLAALGKALSFGSPAPWAVDDALNLDGGRSTDLYISSSIPGGPLDRRGFLNRPVRNFLILIPR